ncbi:hypothetical protein ACLOJK_037524 [Asimina triloba]
MATAARRFSLLQSPSLPSQPLQSKKFIPKPLKSTFPPTNANTSRCLRISCSSSNGRSPDPTDEDGVKEVGRVLEEKRRAEIAARIASGEFTADDGPGFLRFLRQSLLQLGVPEEFIGFLSGGSNAGKDAPKIPMAKGSIDAVRGQAFFIPLYELFLNYGGIFRLVFGPKSFLIVSDPSIAKHILRDNSKAYSKGILSEILEFVMGKGLIPADGEIWRVRRRAIVPALHRKYVAAMINLFGEASDRLCKKLDAAASDGEDVEMESLFSRLTLDVIGKAVFNYDFDSLTNDTGIVEFPDHYIFLVLYLQAVYRVLREAEDRSVSPIQTWNIPIWKDISPRQRKVNEALKLINDTLDELIAVCKRMVDEEELQFHEEYVNERDPSILHFLLASGDDLMVEIYGMGQWINVEVIDENWWLRLVVIGWNNWAYCRFKVVIDGDQPLLEEVKNLVGFIGKQEHGNHTKVSSKQLRDDLMTMLIAGHETSAAVLTWTFYLLVKEPSVMSKLQDEVDFVLGDRFPTVEDMKKLKYTTRVINESLRLYPQPPVLIRRSLMDDVLGKYPIKRSDFNPHHAVLTLSMYGTPLSDISVDRGYRPSLGRRAGSTQLSRSSC